MKKIFTLSLIAFVISASNIYAQTVATFSISELNSYINAYTAPFAKSVPIALSGGWAHTAKVHSTLGFDLSFGTSLVFIPSSEGMVSSSKISFPANSTLSFTNQNVDVPTIRGNGDNIPQLQYTLTEPNTGQSLTGNFDAFKGVGLSLSMAPYIQLGFGLPKGTEIIGRFIPDVSNVANKALSSATDTKLEKTSLWGIGVKHDIKQWIPVVSKLPFLQISGLIAYSQFHTGFAGGDLTITPATLSITSGSLVSNTALWEDQKFNMKASSFTGTLLVGASIPVFQPFIGLGFNSGKFESGLYGTYPDAEIVENTTNGVEFQVNTSTKDPMVIKTNSTNFNFQAGARLKLGPIVINYTLSLQNGYKMHTGALAVTIR